MARAAQPLREIAVYSGSFDPLHIGHFSILERLAALGRFHKTYLVVSPQSPFKEAQRALSAGARLRAARAAVRRHPGLNVLVSGIELGMEPPQYTIRTLDALQARAPRTHFTLVIGGDQLDAFTRWRSYERILLEYGLLVYPRRGYDSEALRAALLRENPAYRIELLDAPLVDISSSRIRELRGRGEDVSPYLM